MGGRKGDDSIVVMSGFRVMSVWLGTLNSGSGRCTQSHNRCMFKRGSQSRIKNQGSCR
jgi:hypothetical protein